MPRYKPVDRSPRFLPVVLQEQLMPGSFERALDHLVDHELDLSALHARFANDATGAPAYDPAVMLKIVLLGYSRGLVSSRSIERACRENVLFIAISGDSAPQFGTLARFVRELGPQVRELFTQVLLCCDALGLIGRQMFAIDGLKLPGNADKRHSGSHAELAHAAQRMERAAARIVAAHRRRDARGAAVAADDEADEHARLQRLQREAARIRRFVAAHAERRSAKGVVRKSNLTDNDSAKMATAKGVIQGYTGVAAVDAAHQIIVAAQAHGSGSEQDALLPVLQRSAAWRSEHTLVTADAGYHSEHNLRELAERGIPALVADTLMRRRDERFAERAKYQALPDPLHDKRAQPRTIRLFTPADFELDAHASRCRCPAGHLLHSNGRHCIVNGRAHHKFSGSRSICGPCELRQRCLRHPQRTPFRQVAFFDKQQASPLPYTARMQQAIDSPRGRRSYARRLATVEPVFANLRHNKRLARFTLRGLLKVDTQWQLYCMVHNIEKLARHASTA